MRVECLSVGQLRPAGVVRAYMLCLAMREQGMRAVLPLALRGEAASRRMVSKPICTFWLGFDFEESHHSHFSLRNGMRVVHPEPRDSGEHVYSSNLAGIQGEYVTRDSF